jgi:Bacteriophage probable baseplate hub protein
MAQTNLDATVKIQATEVTGDEVHDLAVECDLDLPDMAAVVLSNKSTKWTEKVKPGDAVEVKLGFASNAADSNIVFKGEVTGLEPLYDTKGGQRVTVRALSPLHKLARGKKSVAYLNVSDKDIVDKIVGNYGMSAEYGDAPPTVKYDHIYQHNQSDLEFIRLRAARLGFEVYGWDTKLYFRKRTEQDSGISFEWGVGGADTVLERFAPRLSTANQVSEVRVRAWDPEQKKEILGSAKPASSKLGDETGTKVTEAAQHTNVLMIDVDVPVFSKEQADNIAKSILQDRLMSFITGDATVKGNPSIKPGIITTIKCGDQRFDGKYYVTSVRHRYVHEGPEHGYRTDFRFKRDASGQVSGGGGGGSS